MQAVQIASRESLTVRGVTNVTLQWLQTGIESAE